MKEYLGEKVQDDDDDDDDDGDDADGVDEGETGGLAQQLKKEHESELRYRLCCQRKF